MYIWFGAILRFIEYTAAETPDVTNLYLGILLAVVVTITSTFGYYEDSKSADLLAGLSNLRASDVEVIRGIVSLMIGDVVLLKACMQVPADMRIIDCTQGLKCATAQAIATTGSRACQLLPSGAANKDDHGHDRGADMDDGRELIQLFGVSVDTTGERCRETAIDGNKQNTSSYTTNHTDKGKCNQNVSTRSSNCKDCSGRSNRNTSSSNQR